MHHDEVVYIKNQEHDKDAYYHTNFYSSLSCKKKSKREMAF